MKRASILIPAALLAAACSSTGGTPAVATPPAPSSAVTVDALAACRGFFGDDSATALVNRIPDALLGIGAQLDQAHALQLASISTELDKLIAMAPADLAAGLREMQTPFAQASDALTTGGAVTLNTGATRDALPRIMAACASDGYKVGE